MRKFLRQNSLTFVLMGCFLIFFAGQAAAGFFAYNQDRREHRESEISFADYLGSGHFLEASAENWESEFLQMSFYLFLTSFLTQKGSPESKRSGAEEKKETAKALRGPRKKIPWPVRQGGFILKLYENSLTLVLFFLFLLSFGLHAVGGVKEYNGERMSHGQAPVALTAYLSSSRFWFESFQNWQSEFLSIGTLVILTIFLRQKGSHESKPVAAPHARTGH